MPQLDVTTFIPQLFWLGVCFLALYFLMATIILPKISRFLERREKGLEEQLNQASLYREEAETLLAEYEALLADAKRTAQERYKAAAQSFASEVENKKKEFIDRLDEKLRRAEQDLYRARVEVNKEIQSLSTDIAKTILQKITAGSLAQVASFSKRKKS